MKRLDQLVGLPLILRASGRRAGTLAGISLDESGCRVNGLLAEGLGVTERKRFVPLHQVYLIGEVSAIIESKGKKPLQKPRTLEAGQRVLATDGKRIGMLTNALIDLETGSIAALEVSGGWWDDWRSGRTWIRHFQAAEADGIVASLLPDDSGT